MNEIKNGIVVPGKFTAFSNKVAIGQILKEEITHIREAHRFRNNWKPSDLIEKELFSFTDSAEVEA